MILNGIKFFTGVFALTSASKLPPVCNDFKHVEVSRKAHSNQTYNFSPNSPTASWLSPIEKLLFGAPSCQVLESNLPHAKNAFLNHLSLSSAQRDISLEEITDFLQWDKNQDTIMDYINVVKLYIRDQGHLDFSYDMTSVLLGLGRRKGALMTPDSASWIRPYNDCFGTDIDTYVVSVFESNLLLMGKKSIISESLSTYISNVDEWNIQDKMNELHSKNEFLYITFLGDMTGIKPLESRLYAAMMLHQSYPEFFKDWINLNGIEIDDLAYQKLIDLASTLQYTWQNPLSGEAQSCSVLDRDRNLELDFLSVIRKFNNKDTVKKDVLKVALESCPEGDIRGLELFFDNFLSVIHVHGPSTIPGGYLSAVRFTPDEDLLKHEVVEETLKRELGLYYSLDYAYKVVRSAIGI